MNAAPAAPAFVVAVAVAGPMFNIIPNTPPPAAPVAPHPNQAAFFHVFGYNPGQQPPIPGIQPPARNLGIPFRRLNF